MAHEDEPVELPHVPGLQATHALPLLAPLVVECRPAGQRVHDDEPRASEYEPGRHSCALDAPLQKDPSGHTPEQSLPNRPSGQSRATHDDVAPLPAGETVPAGHATQLRSSVAPVSLWYVLSRQLRQTAWPCSG
jgi:hypothetical protein